MNVFRKPQEAEKNANATLYVGNLDPQVSEPLLYELFIQVGPVKLLHLPKDRILRAHQGFGFVEFRTVQDADYALDILRGIRLFSRTLKMKKTDPQSSQTLSGSSEVVPSASIGAKVFVGNLDPLVDEQYLQETFGKFGALLGRPTVLREGERNSKGHAFLEFGDFESSDEAIAKMNNIILMNNRIKVSYAYKDGTSVQHGDEAERLLAQEGKKNLKQKPSKVSKPKRKRR